jgi:hypothetical protein
LHGSRIANVWFVRAVAQNIFPSPGGWDCHLPPLSKFFGLIPSANLSTSSREQMPPFSWTVQ